MFSNKKYQTHVSLCVDDEHIRYAIVAHDNQGFFVVDAQEELLPSGVIVDSHILKARFFSGLLSTIHSSIIQSLASYKISAKHINYSLLLPDDLFINTHITPKEVPNKKKLVHQLNKLLRDSEESYPWIEDHVYLPHYDKYTNRIYIQALPESLSKMYHIVFKESGFNDIKIFSKSYVAEYLIEPHETSLVVIVGKHRTQLIHYRDGHYDMSVTLDVSYHKLFNQIKKQLLVDDNFAREILHRYGVSRAHKEANVYHQIILSVQPLLDYLKKQAQDKKHIYLWYLDIPVVGLSEMLNKQLAGKVKDLDVVLHDHYPFHDVLSLHREESYPFSQVLAHSVVMIKGL